MARVVSSVDGLRAGFSALQQPIAFFDGPGGTQVPDAVIDAMASYLRESNANSGGAFATSRATDTLIASARATAARFLGGSVDEVVFGASMTALNFALSRTAARDWDAGDEIVCTRLDHDANVAPWLELARDCGLVVRFADVDDACRLDLDQLRSLVSARRVSSPTPGRRMRSAPSPRLPRSPRSPMTRARSRGSTRCTTRRTARSTSRPPAQTSFCARRTSSTARISALRSAAASCSRRGGRTRCAPRRPSPSAAATRPGRSRTSCSRASSQPSSTWTAWAGRSSPGASARSGRSSSPGCRTAGRCMGRRHGPTCRDVRDHE